MTIRTSSGVEAATLPRASLVEAILTLGTFVAGLTWSEVPSAVRRAARRVLRDSLAVLVAGGRLDEQVRLREALPVAEGGTATVIGAERLYGVTDAAWLNGNALVALELDEGNKHVRGHATAHVLPAVLAVAEHRHASGEQLAAAFVAGHEVASRFGRATTLRPGVHPHGNWGVAGAAAAVAHLQGGSASDISRAIDAAGAMAFATPFDVATSGLLVRNGWVGSANVAGIHAAGLAVHDQPVIGVAQHSLGDLLGTLDVDGLVAGIGSRYAMGDGYFKRHASCSYTHPPADLALEVHAERGAVSADEVASVRVATHGLGAMLDSTTWQTRMAAMFSIPYVVAVALRDGACGPRQFDECHRRDVAIAELAALVQVEEDVALTAALPEHRAARMTIDWVDGSRWERSVTNPIGDADHLPLSDDQLASKAALLVGSPRMAHELQVVTDALFDADDVVQPMAEIRRLASTRSTHSTRSTRLTWAAGDERIGPP